MLKTRSENYIPELESRWLRIHSAN